MSPNLDVLLAGPVGARIRELSSAGDLELPVFPASAADVLSLCNGGNCDAHELAQCIERDQSLAGHVLRISNSAAYAPNEPIVSLPQAVARLGFGTLTEIAVAIAVRGKVFNVPGFQSTLTELWRHSALCGSFAKEVARTLRKNVEGAFLCGLLHDVGKPVALQLLVDVWKEIGVREELESEVVDAVMHHFHTTLGSTLIDRWGFAPWMRAAVEHHHDYDAAGEFREHAMMTCLADHLAKWAVGNNRVTTDSLVSLEVVADLEIYEDDLEQLMEQKDTILALAEAFA